MDDDSVLKNIDDHPKYCNICDHELMGYVLESVDNGVIHDALFEIFLPHACPTCNKLYTTLGLLQEHLNVCTEVQVDAGDNLFFENSAMSVKAKIKARGIIYSSKPKKCDLIILLEQSYTN